MNKLFLVLTFSFLFQFTFAQVVIRGVVKEIVNNEARLPSNVITVNIDIPGKYSDYTPTTNGNFKFIIQKKINIDDKIRIFIDSKIFEQKNPLETWAVGNSGEITIYIQKKQKPGIPVTEQKSNQKSKNENSDFKYSPKKEIKNNVTAVKSIPSEIKNLTISITNNYFFNAQNNYFNDPNRVASNLDTLISAIDLQYPIYNIDSLSKVFKEYRIILDSLKILKDIIKISLDKLKSEDKLTKQIEDSIKNTQTAIDNLSFWGEKIFNTASVIDDSVKYNIIDGEINYSSQSLLENGYTEIIFPPREGISRIYNSISEKYMFINNSNIPIGYEYEYAEDFNDGLALVVDKSRYDFIDKQGKLLFHKTVGGESYSYLFEKAVSFKNGRALVNKDDDWYFINTKNEKVSSEVQKKNYLEKGFLSDARRENGTNYIWMKYDYYSPERNFLINKKGEIVSPFYHNIVGFNDSLISIVNDDYSWDIIDSVCRKLLKSGGLKDVLDSIYSINNYLFAIRKMGTSYWGIIKCTPKKIDEQGDYGKIADYQYKNVIPAIENLAIVVDSTEKYGVVKINLSGKRIVPIIQCHFENIEYDKKTNQFKAFEKKLIWRINLDGSCVNNCEEYHKINGKLK